MAEHRAALLTVPPGQGRAPVWIALHGAGDRAEDHCAFWTPILGRHAFVLCPRGTPMTRAPDTGFFFRDHHALGRELQAAVAALEQAEPRADTRGMVLSGYSQGGIMGALHAHLHPDQFSRLLLIEGGFAEWDVPTATHFYAGGGKRVAIVCGIAHCAQGAAKSRHPIAKGGLGVSVSHVHGGGHRFDGRVGARAVELLPWLVEDDPRWNPWRSALAQ